MVELTPRLQRIADSIEHYGTLADIGSDHAYLPIYLVKNKKIRKAIASDVNKGPVETANKRIKGNKAEGCIEVRHGNGLEVLTPGEAEVIVIAGMGGILISEILTAGEAVASSADMLVLQPMRDSDKVRKWLFANSFEIIDEDLVKEEHKIYEIIWAKPGRSTGPGDADCSGPMYIGKQIIDKKHPLAKELIARRVKEYQNIVSALNEKVTVNSLERKAECQEMIDYYSKLERLLQ